MKEENKKNMRLPKWLKIKLPENSEYSKINKITEEHHLHTICKSGKCPNVSECWGRGTATFMILGDICTRSCRFCATNTGIPLPVDKDEPKHVADSIKLMNLKHCVLTSVDRDDLEDGGSIFWAETIKTIKEVNPKITMEVLIPDFDGNKEYIQIIIDAKPDIISHNLETVRRLSNSVRSRADYDTSLEVLKYIAKSGMRAKSGIMVGLGEKEEEVFETMDELIKVNCEVFTIGQYLRPSKKQIEIVEYVTPEQFEVYKQYGLKIGFKHIESSPFVRSSYQAEKHIRTN